MSEREKREREKERGREDKERWVVWKEINNILFTCERERKNE